MQLINLHVKLIIKAQKSYQLSTLCSLGAEMILFYTLMKVQHLHVSRSMQRSPSKNTSKMTGQNALSHHTLGNSCLRELRQFLQSSGGCRTFKSSHLGPCLFHRHLGQSNFCQIHVPILVNRYANHHQAMSLDTLPCRLKTPEVSTVCQGQAP